MMKTIALAAVLATAVATGGSARVVDVAGNGSAKLPAKGVGAGAYDVMHVAGRADPWGSGTVIATEVGAPLGPAAGPVVLTYRGNSSAFDNTLVTADGAPLVTANATAPGTTIELSAAEFSKLAFLSDGTGERIGFDSAQVGVTAVANVLEIGFNDNWPGDADFDDLRFAAVVAPVPLPLALLATGAAGLLWARRRARAGA